MARDEKHRQQVNAATAAAGAASTRLKHAHPEEWRTYYEEEARKRGVVPAGSRKAQRARKAQRLRKQAAELEGIRESQ